MKKPSQLKVAIITANFGGIDLQRPIPQQTISFDRFYFTEANTRYPRRDFIPRLKAKFFKIQSHNVDELKDYDVHIWIDAAYEITSLLWLAWMIDKLQGFDIAVTKHQERACIYEEIDFMDAHRNNPYIRSRYRLEPCRPQAEHYRKLGYPAKNGLYACGMFARWNNNKLNNAFNDWWVENTKWSIQDQLSFPVIAEKHHLAINPVDVNLFRNEYFTWKDHKKTI